MDSDVWPSSTPPGPRGWLRRRWVKITIVVALVVVLAYGGAALGVFFYVQGKYADTQQDFPELDAVPDDGRPINVLVLGSDRRDVVDPDVRGERQFRGGSGQRSDTIILVHLSGDQRSAVMVHFPRDLRVRIPGRSGHHKINAAYALGGPGLTIETLKEFSGLQVHHYVEVNFQSFREVVDAVGGVRILVNRTYDDERSGLSIEEPGCIAMDGDLALAFVRARYVDPTGDFGRIERQQRFMRALMSKVTSIGFLLDLPRVVRLANAVSGGVVTDKALDFGTVRKVANRLAGFEQESLDFRVVPSDADTIGGVSYVVARDAEAEALFEALAADEPLPPYGKTPLSKPEPADVTVTVLNGTDVSGLAGRHAERLEEAGYRVRRTGNADEPNPGATRILYEPEAELKAKLIRSQFAGARIAPSLEPLGTDVVVVLGAGEGGVGATPSPGGGGPATPAPEPTRCTP